VILLASGCIAVDPNRPRDPEVELERALRPYAEQRDGSLDAARMRVETVANEFPTYLPAQVLAAELALEVGVTSSAQLHADRALALAPGDPDVRVLRARLAVGDGDLTLAGRLLDEGIRLRPDVPSLRETRAWVRQLGGSYELALTDLGDAERLGASPVRIALHRGIVHERQGDVAAAVAAYEVCLALADEADDGSGTGEEDARSEEDAGSSEARDGREVADAEWDDDFAQERPREIARQRLRGLGVAR
jgi:tetratricopeptide (TPR) repeat protein